MKSFSDTELASLSFQILIICGAKLVIEHRAAAVPTTDGSAKGSTGSPLAVTGGTVSIAALMLGLLALALGAVIRRRRVREN